jgi:hypothetical protein
MCVCIKEYVFLRPSAGWIFMFTYQGSLRKCSIIQRTACPTVTRLEDVNISLANKNYKLESATCPSYHTKGK